VRLFGLVQLNDDMLAAVGEGEDVPPELHEALALSQLKNYYLLLDRVEPLPDYPAREFSATVPDSNRWDAEDFRLRRVQNLRRGALARGAELLRAQIDGAGDAAPVRLAALHLALGDWYQWNGRPENAAEPYAEVVRLLRASGQADTLRDWLAEPVELPDNGVFLQEPLGGRGDGPGAPVRLRFDVSAQGRARAVEAVAVPEGEEARANRLQRDLRSVRFRPRWISGEPESVTGLSREYSWGR